MKEKHARNAQIPEPRYCLVLHNPTTAAEVKVLKIDKKTAKYALVEFYSPV